MVEGKRIEAPVFARHQINLKAMTVSVRSLRAFAERTLIPLEDAETSMRVRIAGSVKIDSHPGIELKVRDALFKVYYFQDLEDSGIVYVVKKKVTSHVPRVATVLIANPTTA